MTTEPIDALRRLLASQYEASLSTLGHCIVRCPEALWNRPVARYPFCQVAFHTLFFADVYLGANTEAVRQQPFHREHRAFFADYEQLEDREPVSLYERPMIVTYLEFCRAKAGSTVGAESMAILTGPTGFERRTFSRAELHLYNIRHIQHHAAQLILRLRLDSDVDIPWIGAGWRSPAAPAT